MGTRKAPPSCTSVSGPPPACLLAISRFSASSVVYIMHARNDPQTFIMTIDQPTLTCIGGCDADTVFAVIMAPP